MSFSQATITYVAPPIQWGGELLLNWSSTSPAGTWFQVYVDDALAWYGTSTTASVALPSGGVYAIDIGTVGPGEQQTNFSADLPATPNYYAEIAWTGGLFESPNLIGFYVYGSDAPGGAVDYSAVLATITAFTGAAALDPPGTYSWTAGPLTSGTWTYAVVPYDSAGNSGTAATSTVTIEVPPIEPAPFPDRTRLHYTYAAPPYEVTLNWNSSPTA
jgi:hypothetical protein